VVKTNKRNYFIRAHFEAQKEERVFFAYMNWLNVFSPLVLTVRGGRGKSGREGKVKK
jgi:hypothetical protein